MPAAITSPTHRAAFSTESKPARKATARRGLENTDRDFGDDPKQPLGPGHGTQQVEPGGIELLAAKAYHLAAHQRHFEAQEVVGGEPVLQAVHAAGVFRHIAADGAGHLAGGIRRIIIAVGADGGGDSEIGDPGPAGDGAVGDVDIGDGVEPGKPQDDAVGQR